MLVLQLSPPSIEYCQVAPSSRPLTVITPLLVMKSPATPLSVSSETTGAATVWSTLVTISSAPSVW